MMDSRSGPSGHHHRRWTRSNFKIPSKKRAAEYVEKLQGKHCFRPQALSANQEAMNNVYREDDVTDGPTFSINVTVTAGRFADVVNACQTGLPADSRTPSTLTSAPLKPPPTRAAQSTPSTRYRYRWWRFPFSLCHGREGLNSVPYE